MIEQPTVTANDQGQDAEKQAGVIAHNDIPAATNDPTDAPKLEMTPEAREATALTPPEIKPPAFEPTPEQVATADALIASEEAEQARVDAMSADEIAALEGDGPASLDPKFDVVPANGGVWQCQNVKCHNLFEAGTQSAVQGGGVPLLCPRCNSDHVLYIGESRESAQEVV